MNALCLRGEGHRWVGGDPVCMTCGADLRVGLGAASHPSQWVGVSAPRPGLAKATPTPSLGERLDEAAAKLARDLTRWGYADEEAFNRHVDLMNARHMSELEADGRKATTALLDDLEAQLAAAHHWGSTVCDARDRIFADLEAAHRRIEYLEGALGDAEERIDDLLADVADEHACRNHAEERASELADRAGELEAELKEAHATMGRMVTTAERVERDAKRGRR